MSYIARQRFSRNASFLLLSFALAASFGCDRPERRGSMDGGALADASPGLVDGGAPADGGGPTDGGASDADLPLDAGPRPDAGPGAVLLRVGFAGGGSASVRVESVDGTVGETCTSACDVTAPAGSGGFVVSVVETDRSGLFVGFDGPCRAGATLFECQLGEGSTDVTVRVIPSGAPDATAQRFGGSRRDTLQHVAMDSNGNRYVVASLDDAVLGGSTYRDRVLFSVAPDGTLRFARELTGVRASAVAGIAVDPTTDELWLAALCSGFESFDGTSTVGDAGPCVARYAASGTPLGSRVWEGSGSLTDIAIGADGTVAVLGVLSASATWDGVTLRRGDGNQFVARILPASTSFAFARVLAEVATDHGTALAVGDDGSIYAAGTVRGPTTVGGLSFEDLASFQFQAYLLRLDGSGATVDELRLGSTDISGVAAVITHGSAVYVAGDYGGALDIGNSTSLSTRGLSTYPYVARFDTDLTYRWHTDGELWADVKSLAPDPAGGVLVTTDIDDVFHWMWETGESAYLVAPVLNGATLGSLSPSGEATWMTRVCDDCSARVVSSGSHVAVAGSYGSTVEIAPVGAARGYDVYVADVGD